MCLWWVSLHMDCMRRPMETWWVFQMWAICTYTGHLIMFSVITKIYNKETKGPTLMEFFTATGKLKKFFLTARDVRCVHHGWHHTSIPYSRCCHTRVNMLTCVCVARTWISCRCVPCYPWCTHRMSLVKKNFFSFPVAVNKSIKVGPLVFLL